MNIERAKVPWYRRYNWRQWYRHNSRCIRWFVTGLLVGLLLAIGEFVFNLYLEKLEAQYQKVSVVGTCWKKELMGAPVTGEDAILIAEPVGFKVAYNWKKLGWRE